MSTDFKARIIGFIFFTSIGIYSGTSLAKSYQVEPLYTALMLGWVGALLGLIITPFITVRPIKRLRARISQAESMTITTGLIGMICGLLVAALVAFPLSLLPTPFGEITPIIGAVFFGYLGTATFIMRKSDILDLFVNRIPRSGLDKGEGVSGSASILVDTSVIIDGRVIDIVRTGFIRGNLIIPRFVLQELQFIADSTDPQRRQRGRRGLDILSELQKESIMPVRISDIDVEGAKEVDDKLIILARQMHAPILTNDYNLNRIAELQGVSILNINDLANSVKAILLPGENISVLLIQEGKESDQGVGYLDDGTMVVVENGANSINREIEVVVTKVLQTTAGRMIFAKVNGTD